MKNKYITIGILAVAVFFGNFYINRSSEESKIALGGSINFPNIGKMATSTFKVIGSSDTLVLASTTCQQYVELVNDSPRTIYLALNGDVPAVYNSGIMLSASSTYIISQDKNNLYTGAIRAISNANANLTVSCY